MNNERILKLKPIIEGWEECHWDECMHGMLLDGRIYIVPEIDRIYNITPLMYAAFGITPLRKKVIEPIEFEAVVDIHFDSGHTYGASLAVPRELESQLKRGMRFKVSQIVEGAE